MIYRLLFLVIFCGWASFSSAEESKYITGETIRSLCEFGYDDIHGIVFDPKRMEDGSVFFISTHYLGDFFQKIRPQITKKYIIVSHDSDLPAPGPFEGYLDDPLLVVWFAQNLEASTHPKIQSIPIGIAKSRYSHGDLKVLSSIEPVESRARPYLLYMNFSPSTNADARAPVYARFQDTSYCAYSRPKDFASYLNDLAHSKFVLCPRGNGLDCHRTWESLYLGAIPVLKSSSLDRLFDNLPVLIVDDWSQINKAFLEEKFEEISSKNYDIEKLSIDYWSRLINLYKNQAKGKK